MLVYQRVTPHIFGCPGGSTTEAIASGRGGAIVACGPAGSGKSRGAKLSMEVFSRENHRDIMDNIWLIWLNMEP